MHEVQNDINLYDYFFLFSVSMFVNMADLPEHVVLVVNKLFKNKIEQFPRMHFPYTLHYYIERFQSNIN